jgi:hypothetical protein
LSLLKNDMDHIGKAKVGTQAAPVATLICSAAIVAVVTGIAVATRVPTVKSALSGISASIISRIVTPARAEETTSPNFKIEGDSLDPGSLRANSTNFGLSGDLNPFAGLSSSTSFKEEFGYNPRIRANTPYAPTLTNPNNYYSKLKLVVDASGNPSDTLFAIAVQDTTDSTIYFVQDDNTIGAALGIEDYKTYTNWGNTSGFLILNLAPDTGYKMRVKALHGDFTETGWGPESAEVKTTVPAIAMSITGPDAPFGSLSPSTVSESTTITLTIDTNCENGYQVFAADTGDGVNPGLYDGSAYLIPSADALLSAGTEGYGAQVSSAFATIDSKYDLTGNSVGGLLRGGYRIAYRVVQPTSSETISIKFKAAMSGNTDPGTYTDIVYWTVSSSL